MARPIIFFVRNTYTAEQIIAALAQRSREDILGSTVPGFAEQDISRYDELQRLVRHSIPCALLYSLDTEDPTPLQVRLSGTENVLTLLKDTAPLPAPLPLMFQMLIIAADIDALTTQIIQLVDARASEAA